LFSFEINAFVENSMGFHLKKFTDSTHT